MNLYSISDKIVFKILQEINNGYLEIKKLDGELIRFGNPKHSLKAYIKIKKPNFTFNLIKGGSIGFAESYMRDEFETNNLSNLIEITARNIKIIYKFSGLLDLPIINFFKNTLIKNTKRRSKESGRRSKENGRNGLHGYDGRPKIRRWWNGHCFLCFGYGRVVQN